MSETPLDLAAIRAGIDVLTEDSYHQPWSDEWALEMKRDLYRVVAEVERLRAENADLLASWGSGCSRIVNDMRRAVLLDAADAIDLSPWYPDGLDDLTNAEGAAEVWLRRRAANAIGKPRTGPVAANGPAQVAADPAQGDDAGEGEAWEPPTDLHGRPSPQVPLLDEWGRRHEDNAPPIGPPFSAAFSRAIVDHITAGAETEDRGPHDRTTCAICLGDDAGEGQS